MTAVKMPHVNVVRHFAVQVKWITLYNNIFLAFPEFIITPSLVVKLSTTTANDDGSGVYYRGGFRPYIRQISLQYFVAFKNYNYLNFNAHFSK